MKQRNIIYTVLIMFGLMGVHNTLWAQSAGLSLSWNGSAYVVKMDVTAGANPLLLGSSQITIVTPASMSTAGMVVNCGAPCSPNTWTANTFVNAPSAAPGSNFVAVSTLGGNMGNVTAGASITLFTFTLVGGCDNNVRLFNNGTDPNSAQMPAGQDFANTLVNVFPAVTEFYNGSNNNNVVCVAAPLELLRFAAQKTGADVQLQWATQNETDMSHFVVERATDAHHFRPIGRQQAQNVPDASYAYLDQNVPTTSEVVYYRLKAVDLDSSFTYTPVRSVRLSSAAIRFTVQPNPAQRGTEVVITVAKEQTISLQVTDAAGALRYSERHPLQAGTTNIPLDVTAWPSGTYVVSVRQGDTQLDQRLIVQH